jgi:phosphate transport system ATP-binding protein
VSTIYGIDAGGSAPVLEARALSVFHGSRPVVRDVSLVIPERRVVALVGPSGCGKSALLRSLNRMNELEPGVRVDGQLLFRGKDIHAPGVEPAAVRQLIGMVFPRPNPFPGSIFENVAFGPRVSRFRGDLNRLVEESLRRAALWDEVSDRLHESARGLSAGQQQRLCIARALAVSPAVLLMDEPTANLDPAAAQGIEELMYSLKSTLTVVLVTHNLQHAARASDFTAFLQDGELVEYGPTDAIFTKPRDPRTEAHVTGRFA